MFFFLHLPKYKKNPQIEHLNSNIKILLANIVCQKF